jgi:hypothetical protein
MPPSTPGLTLFSAPIRTFSGDEVYKGKLFLPTSTQLKRKNAKVRIMSRLPISSTASWRKSARRPLIAKPLSGWEIKRYPICHVILTTIRAIVKANDPRGQDVFNYVEDISKSEGLPVHFSLDGDEVLITQ